MLIVIGVDILTRSLFNFSFEISDELGGYMLVVITFVSLSVCQISDSFPPRRVGPVSPLAVRPRGLALIFDLLRFVRRSFCGSSCGWSLTSFHFGDRAPTYLATPLWLPQTSMMLGAAPVLFRAAHARLPHVRRAPRVARDAGGPR